MDSGSWPYYVWNECGNCGYDKFPSETPPTYCPNCGTVLTGGYTANEYNEKAKKFWDELHEERRKREEGLK